MSGESQAAAARPALWWGFWVFVSVMLVLTGVFVSLGLWQLDRLHQKEALTTSVGSRQNLEPVALPPAAEWPAFDAAAFDYRPVTVTGQYLLSDTVLVFTSLVESRGIYEGPGYWVMTPLVLDGGGTVFVNRGFIPQGMRDMFANGGDGTTGTVTLTGLARASERATSFTPGPDTANRIEWVRDIERMAALVPAAVPVASVYIDLPAGEPGALPQGGETTVNFPNNHFGYALTWFGFALITPILLLTWIIRQVRTARDARTLR